MSNLATVQQLLNENLNQYRQKHKLDKHRYQVLKHLQSCHTPILGGIQYQCDQCLTQLPKYHSCRDRHCPQCQQRATKQWSEKQQGNLIPCSYFHLVFTLPHELNAWAQLHPEVIYPLLFKVVWATLKSFGEDPKRLNGQIGMTAVLHTWGQNLSSHNHIHCLIPGGALSAEQQWHPVKGAYLFPVKALSRYYCGKMVHAIRQAKEQGKLKHITDEQHFDQTLNQLMSKQWVVYAKHSFHHKKSIVDYLARYTHRIAISDHRIVSIDNEQVSFKYKDYRTYKNKIMTLKASEFIRRFLMHILPKGLKRLRHYGFLANRIRESTLKKIRTQIKEFSEKQQESKKDPEKTPKQGNLCPACKKGHLVQIKYLEPRWVLPEMVPG